MSGMAMKQEKAVPTLRDIIREMPVVYRLAVLTIAPMLVVLAVAVSDRVMTELAGDDLDESRLHPQFAGRLRAVLAELHAEHRATHQYLAGRANRSTLDAARAATDAEYERANAFYYAHAKVLNTEKYLENSNMHGLVHVRGLVDNGGAWDPTDVSLLYSNQRSGFVLQSWETLRGSQRDHEELDSHYVAYLGVSLAGAYFRLEQAAVAAKLGAATDQEDREADAKWHRYTAMRGLFLDLYTETAPASERDYIDSMLASREWQDLHRMEGELRQYTVTPDAQAAAAAFDLQAWDDSHAQVLTALGDAHAGVVAAIIDGLDDAQKDLDTSAAIDVALICFTVWSVCVLGVFCWLQGRNAKREAKQRVHLIGMLENLNRVAEYASHMGFFDLQVPMLAKGRRITQQENVLMRAIGALKVVAPALSPSLFPERFFCRPVPGSRKMPCAHEMMMNCLPPYRSSMQQSRPGLLTEQDTEESEAIAQMVQRTRLGLTVRHASLATFSTSFLHRIVAMEKDGKEDAGLQNVERHLPKYISTVEQVVIQYHGLLHRLCGDRLLCVWNAGKSCDKHQVMASRAGLQATARLRQLSFEDMYIAAAITSGEVVVGNIGFEPQRPRRGADRALSERSGWQSPAHPYAESQRLMSDSGAGEGSPTGGGAPPEENPCSLLQSGFKTFEVFGPCVAYGMRVAHFQKLHSTSTCVLCDASVAAAISHQFQIKPLELLRTKQGANGIERIYEVAGARQSRQSEAQLKLDQYTNAFELFEGRKLREAAKAFRGYTKVYGYDSSVERIQGLIAERKTVDELEADEKRWI
eukprot:TRINITY_DN50372_c0_g1_i1.p1 TRINITY_DN50372_c0_g1~~TRINITY_DN50372_c0_g1_i1.p1  ORF type:complete len:810 (+),score=316.20 TRINITY_DN50372_c0_g1_i1:91-2520(+)